MTIENTGNPEIDACRALYALSVAGKLLVWRKDARPDMTARGRPKGQSADQIADTRSPPS
jgi:hypothetical protein